MIALKSAARSAAAIVAAFVFALAVGAAEPAGVTLANADIVAMTKANVAPMTIVGRIYSSPNKFDLSDQAFMELKANGVADEVLNAMLAASKAGGAAAAASGGAGQRPNDISMQFPTLPPLGGSDWSDFGQDLASLPPPPALPAFSAPPGSAPAPLSVPGTPPALTTPPTLAMPPQTQTAQPSAPPTLQAPVLQPPATAGAGAANDPFSYAPALTPPPMPATPAPMPAPPSAPAFSAPPAVQQRAAATPPAAPAPAAAGGDARRLESELTAIAQGSPEARRSGLAWVLANQQQTLPGLRQALSSPRAELQAGAVHALGALNDQASLPQLRDLLGSPAPMVRKETAKTLAQMNDTLAIGAAEQNLSNPVEPLDGLIYLVGYARLVRASERLGAILADNRAAINRAAAAAALAEIGRAGSVAWPALEKALAGDADPSVRREAARAVAEFHDPSSAALLMNACRRDPDVRKVTLEAMADYPETVGFLVAVVGLGTDQIAPDELETARSSLAKLTGQNFGLDGPQWSAWFAENRSRFNAGAPVSFVAAAPSASAPAPSSPRPATATQVDITALGMIVDPSQIPMAPEVDDRFGAPAAPGGPLRLPVGGTLPGALSATDFGAAEAMGQAGGGGPATAAGASGGVGAGRLPTPAGFEEYADEQMWGGSMPSGGMGMGGMGAGAPASAGGMGMGMGGYGGGSTVDMPPPSTMSSLPQQPVVAPAPSAPIVDAAPDSGLRLALPPMMGGGDDMGMGGGDVYAAPSGIPDGLLGAGVEYAEPAQTFDAPIDESAVLYNGSPVYDASEWQQYVEPESATSYEAAETVDPYAQYVEQGTTTDSAPVLTVGGYSEPPAVALPIPGGSPESIAFPGDTDAFGLGEPMFEDETADAFGLGGGASPASALVMPSPPGGGTPATAATPLEGYEYGEYNDNYGDSDGDFASDDFARYLGGSGASGGEAGSASGSAEWAPGTDLPPIGEPYTVDTVAPDGTKVMEWVRGVGLVERDAPPETVISAPASGAEAGEWHYVEPYEDPTPGGVPSGSPTIIEGDVYETAEPAVLPTDPSGRPSRRLRKQ